MATRKEEIRRERKEIQQRVSQLSEDESSGGDEEPKSKKDKKSAELTRLKDLKAKEIRRKLERVTAEGGLRGIPEEGKFDIPPHDEHILTYISQFLLVLISIPLGIPTNTMHR